MLPNRLQSQVEFENFSKLSVG